MVAINNHRVGRCAILHTLFHSNPHNNPEIDTDTDKDKFSRYSPKITH